MCSIMLSENWEGLLTNRCIQLSWCRLYLKTNKRIKLPYSSQILRPWKLSNNGTSQSSLESVFLCSVPAQTAAPLQWQAVVISFVKIKVKSIIFEERERANPRLLKCFYRLNNLERSEHQPMLEYRELFDFLPNNM